MNDNDFKDIFKLVNNALIIVCFILNFMFMFRYKPLDILISEFIVFLVTNISLFFVYVMEVYK